MSFAIKHIDLSMVDPETGNYLQASTYTVPGIVNDDGSLRQLSIGQLVMAICLKQATEIESQIVEKMASMADTIVRLEVLTKMQEVIVNNPDANGNLQWSALTYDNTAWPDTYSPKADNLDYKELADFLTTPTKANGGKGGNYGAGCTGVSSSSSSEEIVSAISTALDNFNTVNQEEMIDLQSLTNKRDQRYDLITNMLKSFNNVMASIANNL